jgi:hypothetical protein
MDGYPYTYLEMKNMNFEINNALHKSKEKDGKVKLPL